jgi:glucose-1-phosphate adenylyltransferase
MIDHENPLHSVPRCLPPARFTGKVEMTNSIVSEGVLVGGGSSVTNSVLGPCVVLGENTTIIECIFIGHQETGYLHGDGAADVGSGSVLRNCVVHSDVVIGENCFLTNENGEKDKNGLDINRVTVDPETGKGYVIQDGIIVFMPGTVVAAGTVI